MNKMVRKILLISADAVLGAYLVAAATVLNTPQVFAIEPSGTQPADRCQDVFINIEDNGSERFLNEKDVVNILESKRLYPKDKLLAWINIRAIEETLIKSPFISDAQCYKSQAGNVCISVSQYSPVVRVKAQNGDDYYVDSHGGLLPNTKYISNIVVASGYIDKNYSKRVLKSLGNIIAQNEFWQHEIVQINVMKDGTLEIVPRIGNHIVYLGTPDNFEDKLNRLELFYRYGLRKIGWSKYSYISVAFSNQIICKKRNKRNESTI